jgi:hypothetical protein
MADCAQAFRVQMTTADAAASIAGRLVRKFSGDLAGCAPVSPQPAEDPAAGGIDHAKDRVRLLTLPYG